MICRRLCLTVWLDSRYFDGVFDVVVVNTG
jgi:hypothetical protein